MNYSKNEVRKFLAMIKDEEFRKRIESAGVIIITKDAFNQEEATNTPADMHKSKFDGQSDEEIEMSVKGELRKIGFKTNCKGYYYLPKAILIILRSGSPWDISMTKTVYPQVAKEFCTTSSRVERAIRHAIQAAFLEGNLDKLSEIFGYTISSKNGTVTNSEFIYRIAEVMKATVK